MFTGLIEEQGKIASIELTSDGMEITIFCEKILSDVKKGASICVNGACQTVISFTSNSITVQASNETLHVTNFKDLKAGDNVNLERALTLNTRLDGHIVTGHIDCTAEFLNKKNDGFSLELFFKLPDDKLKYIIYKGAIAVNGVSLTIASINKNVFSTELIPLTLKTVNLSALETGDIVNIETDIIAKYIENFVNSKDNKSNINYNFLKENGFV